MDPELIQKLNSDLYRRADRGRTEDFWAAITEPLKLKDKVRMLTSSKRLAAKVCSRQRAIVIDNESERELFGRTTTTGITDFAGRYKRIYQILKPFISYVEKFDYQNNVHYCAINELIGSFQYIQVFKISNLTCSHDSQIDSLYSACYRNFNHCHTFCLFNTTGFTEDSKVLAQRFATAAQTQLRNVQHLESSIFDQLTEEPHRANLLRLWQLQRLKMFLIGQNGIQPLQDTMEIYPKLKAVELYLYDRFTNQQLKEITSILLTATQLDQIGFVLDIADVAGLEANSCQGQWPLTVTKFSIHVVRYPQPNGFLKAFTKNMSSVKELSITIEEPLKCPISISPTMQILQKLYIQLWSVLVDETQLFKGDYSRITLLSLKISYITVDVLSAIQSHFPGLIQLQLAGRGRNSYASLTDDTLAKFITSCTALEKLLFQDNFHRPWYPKSLIKFYTKAKQNPQTRFVFAARPSEQVMNNFNSLMLALKQKVQRDCGFDMDKIENVLVY